MMFEVDRLCAGYGKTEIVHDVSFTALKGEFVCIIGPNGCGKTTMLKSMLGLIKPFSGSVSLDGVNTTELTERERARRFAYIPQLHTPPFPFTVSDVVMMGRTPYVSSLSITSPEDRRVAYNAMVELGIEDLAARNYTDLSGGQQQLVLIARSLAQEPDFLIMDEPTASLDFGNQQMVLKRMRGLAERGAGVIMVTHDPDHALFCATRVIAMEGGRIIGDGTPDEVMTDECMQEIYGTCARIVEVEIEPGKKTRVCIPV